MNNKKPRLVISVLLLFIQVQLIGQGSQTPSPVAMERITPASPEAVALGKFGTVPMGLFTGTPNISIDLFKLKAKQIELPVTLNYSSNGIKVDEVANRTGMSWLLNAGGVVTRTIYDKPDDKYAQAGAPPSTNFNASSTTLDHSLVIWTENVDVNHQDTQFDEYSFNFNGYSGKFIIDLNGNPVLFPYSNIKVEVNLTSTAWNFRITTPDGMKYYFGEGGAKERTLTGSGSCSREDAMGANSAWYLTRIENPNDPSDYITLTYNSTTYAYTSHITHTLTYWDPTNTCGVNVNEDYDVSCGCGPTPCIYGTPTGYTGILGVDKFCISQNIYHGVYLNEITSSLYGKVHFSYITKPGVNTGNDYLLSSMQIYQNIDGTGLLKTINFNYTMANPLAETANIYYQNNPSTEPTSARPFLTFLQQLDKTGAVIGTHSFEYNEMNNLPPRLSFKQDYFGYYNGAANFSTFIPLPEQYPDVLPSSKRADRSSNYTYAAKGILTKVTYPTGGYTQLVWEGNSTQPVPPTSLASSGGGLRIKQQIVYDPVSLQSITTNYQYAGMKIPFSPSYYNHIVSKKPTSQFVQEGSNKYCLYRCDIENVYASYIQFSSNSSVNLNGRGGSLVYYTSVAESVGDNFILGGTEHTYNYAVYPSFSVLKGEVIKSVVMPLFNWKNGLELTRNDFKMVGATKVYLKKVTNTYVDDSRITQSFTQYVFRNNGNSIDNPYCTDNFGFWKRMDFFDVMSYPLSTKWTYLSSSQVIDYDQDGNNPLTTTTNYFYDNLTNAMPSRVETVNSEGQSVKTVKKYPGDEATITNLTSTESDAITKLKTQNNYSPVLESEQYVNNVLQARVHSGYKDWGSGRLKPEIIKNHILSNPIESRIQFTNYDANSNLLSQNKTNDIPNSYIWDYKSTYPIAEVISATSPNIAYTSFEADGKGNWSYTGTPAADVTSPTGKKAFTIVNSTNNITKSGLSATGTYIISYWKKSGTVGVNGTTSITGRIVNGWTYYEHKVINPAGGLITVSGTSGIIDELRLYPSAAQMTTYTYEPLIGMTSQCDANNRIIYYEYDGFQRLILVRDQERNVIKKICYNYAGQPENCVAYPNDDKSGNYTRSCSAGYSGSTVNVSIPAGMFTSGVSVADANNMATAYGQAQANANGTCTASTTCSFMALTGFVVNSGTISKSGSTVNFTITFRSASGTATWGTLNAVANISGICIPGTTKVFQVSENGRTWQVVITVSGIFNVQLLSGTAPSGTNTVTLTGSYAP